QLVEENYLISRERSGIYVNPKILEGRVESAKQLPSTQTLSPQWRQRCAAKPLPEANFDCPSDWKMAPYPFIYGKYDNSLFPIREWREASRLAMSVRDTYEWCNDSGGQDDPLLIEQIAARILPRRGIQARKEEILITIGSQQSLYLLADLLVQKATKVAIEEPSYPALVSTLKRQRADIIHQPVDHEGMLIDDKLDAAELIYVTPSHQNPTSVTMSPSRRKALLKKAARFDQLIIEDDAEFESNYLDKPQVAIRGMDKDNRVIYLGCLSQALTPGLSIGFMVAAPEIIEQARRLRQIMVQYPPMNNQRAAAYFLSQGYFDSYLARCHEVLSERWVELRRAVNYYLLFDVAIIPAKGGTALMMTLSDPIELDTLVSEAQKQGLLIEPMRDYYATDNEHQHSFRMAITSLPVNHIRAGVVALRNLIHDLKQNPQQSFDSAGGELLTGERLKAIISNARLLCKIAYGDPCTIDFAADGRLIGQAGFSNEDCDRGLWFVENDKLYRQWNRWQWGELVGYQVVKDGNSLKLYDQYGYLIEHAELITDYL
ncbi:MAG: PLP-dependent aminotransferase family protein, partial [Pseudomonadales bacterium]|nr:PLP-dependent aminotransferase family protein [Pseudomonadales bacterium]